MQADLVVAMNEPELQASVRWAVVDHSRPLSACAAIAFLGVISRRPKRRVHSQAGMGVPQRGTECQKSWNLRMSS